MGLQMYFNPRVWLVLAFVFYTSACASIVGDETQPVSVDTPKCPQASCRLTNSQGTYFVKSTPETVVVNKAYSDMTMTCEKGDKSANSVHMSKANGATYGNILLGGIPGALIDGGSGAGYDYPAYLVNPLNCQNLSSQTLIPTANVNSAGNRNSATLSKATEERLRELKDLQNKGLISDEEAEEKRREILDAM